MSGNEQPSRHRLVLVQTDNWVRAYVDGQFFDDGFDIEHLGGKRYDGWVYLLERFGIHVGVVNIPKEMWDQHLYEDAFFDRQAASMLAEMKEEEPDREGGS